MQEAELKGREEGRFKKEREREEEEQSKGKKQEAEVVVKPDKEPEKIAKKQIVFKLPSLQPREFKEIKIREYGFNKEFSEIIVSKIPFLQPKEIKEIKSKIKTFFTEIAEIKAIKGKIPKISFQTKPFKGVSRKILAFNIIVPSTEKKNINLAVPDLRTKHFDGFEAQKTNFNLELPEISVPERHVFVPRIWVKTFSGVKATGKAFTPNIPQVLSELISSTEVMKKEKEEIKEITEIEKETAIEVSGGEAEKALEMSNFFELLLGKGGGRISEGKAICIVVPRTRDEYEKLIAILCRDIYREKIGGLPIPISRDEIKDLLHELESLAERRIIVVKKVEEVSKELLQILEQFYAQGMGFLILVTSNPSKLKEEIERRGEISQNLITVNPPPEIEKYRDIILGFIRGRDWLTQAERFKEKNVSLGEEFKTAIEKFDSELIEKYLNPKRAPEQLRYDWDRLVVSSPEDDKDASPIHSAMKAFVWIYEWKKHEKKMIPELEKREGEDGGSRIVDVKIEDKNYEIETLFGVEDTHGKLTKKIKNYSRGEKVYFVLRNLDVIRNLSQFLRFRRDWRKAGYKVQFFGLNLENEELVPLEVFMKVMKSQKPKGG